MPTKIHAHIDQVVLTTGDQSSIGGVKDFTSRPTVNGTGILLSGESPNFQFQLPNTIVYTTGNQNVSGLKTFLNPVQVGTGSVSFVISENGNVGINTETPIAKLHVSSGSVIFENESSDPVLRITQKTNGTGPVLVVEDQDNPDSTPFLITSAGNVIIGNSEAAYTSFPLQMLSDGEQSLGSNMLIKRHGAGAPLIRFERASGTLSQPTPVIRDQVLGRLLFHGYTTGESYSGFSASAEIVCSTYSNNHYVLNGSGAIPSKISFLTEGSGEIERTEKFRFTPDAELYVGKGVFPSTEFNRGANIYSIPKTDINIPLGFSNMAFVRNGFTGQLNKGEVVYIGGAQGDKPLVFKASNTGEATSSKTFGLAAENIPQDSDGYIITNGSLYNLNLAAFNDGDSVWLGSDQGSITGIKPQAPAHSVFLGIVEKAGNGNNGILYVKVQNGYELNELHDVFINTPLSGDSIVFENNLWVNKKIDYNNLTNKPEAYIAAMSIALS